MARIDKGSYRGAHYGVLYCEFEDNCEWKHKKKIKSRDEFKVLCKFDGTCNYQTIYKVRDKVVYQDENNDN